MAQTDKWFMIQPKYFQAMQDYMDLMKCQLDGGCGATLKATAAGNVTASDLELVSRRVNRVKRALKGQM